MKVIRDHVEKARTYPRRLIKGSWAVGTRWGSKGRQRPVQPGWLKDCGDQAEGPEKLGSEQWVMEGTIQERLIEWMWLGCWHKAGSGGLSTKTDGFKDGSFLDRPTTWPNQEDRLKDIENLLVGARSCPRRLIEGKLGCSEQAVGERRPVTGTQLCSRLIRAWPQTAGVARELKHKVDHDNGFGIFAC